MQPLQLHFRRGRIDLVELKVLMVKKLGPEGSNHYFYFLSMFLSLKVNKVEFNRICRRIVGRENIPLHNHLIRSIIRNVCGAKDVPFPCMVDVSKQNGLYNCMMLRDRRIGDRRGSGLATQSNGGNAKLKNRDLHSNRIAREIQSENENYDVVSSKNGGDTVVRVVENEAFAKSPISAPSGVCFISRAHRDPPETSNFRSTRILNDVALSDSLTLRERMEQIAVTEGLEGTSVDSADVLNYGLDFYMKRLIKSCVDVGQLRLKMKPHNNMKLINGFLQNGDENTRCPISSKDFRVSMELNRRKLGHLHDRGLQ
ncbi:uncharacterized protein LOC127243255 [Andrographis paniculata]|uniref:uncharacterized protein LOC127243255 n=1 Tax=Andrographis paniculata TaxID=175694 RepID=UPI0021E88BA5|nr:uncharacterized protein LOC127243255 [Andrographis paniculata]XP_051119130.1 uncharacterized protein LOC127243255 [Andrographis paniculata]XP_051119131.1 uncharacterized protein LOC127243255 [Andrographis paniculata]XP_051119132.1 uncharacterized protein LOC127243255 [Andrographis paniculata]XP_051119133.1 uncharacterized protein LOC127243255 [Andrographis paniculata]